MKTIATYDELHVPEYALDYFVNGTEPDTEENKLAYDNWFKQFSDEAAKTPGAIAQFCAGDGEGYFCKYPAFGLACNVVDCTVLILVSEPKNGKATKEHFPHDVCPKCGTASVPVEKVPDQSFRGCPKCLHTWIEDLTKPATHKIMKNKNAHTPGKLTVDNCPDSSGYSTIRPSNGTEHGNTDAQPICTAFTEANALRLALCWNSHDALVEALESCDAMMAAIECGHQKPLGFGCVMDEARAALKLAKGE